MSGAAPAALRPRPTSTRSSLRERILDAASELFYRHGIRRSVGTLTARSGVAKMSFVDGAIVTAQITGTPAAAEDARVAAAVVIAGAVS